MSVKKKAWSLLIPSPKNMRSILKWNYREGRLFPQLHSFPASLFLSWTTLSGTKGKLVVLSACQTGSGKLERAEGVNRVILLLSRVGRKRMVVWEFADQHFLEFSLHIDILKETLWEHCGDRFWIGWHTFHRCWPIFHRFLTLWPPFPTLFPPLSDPLSTALQDLILRSGGLSKNRTRVRFTHNIDWMLE